MLESDMDKISTSFIFSSEIKPIEPERKGVMGKEFYGNDHLFIKSVDRNVRDFQEDVIFSNGILNGTSLEGYIPEYSFAYGNNHNGENRGFIVMKRVWGKDIEDIDKLDFDTLMQLDHLITLSIEFAMIRRRFPDIIHSYVDDSGNEISRLTNIRMGITIPSTLNQVYLTDFMSMTDLQYVQITDMFKDLNKAIIEFQGRTGSTLTLSNSKISRLLS